jgi:hypothetical protein
VIVVALAAVAAGAVSALAAGLPTTEKQEIATTAISTDKSFCGTKQITLAVLDGFGINTWSQASYAAVRSEAAKCPNVKQIAIAGGGDLNKMIADVNTAVTQGANAMTIIPDFGKAELAAIQAATAAGVKVVPWGADPSGVDGKDFVQYVDWRDPVAGTMWANWMVKALHGKGNVVFTGGPAGNPVGLGQLKNIVRVFAKYPKMHLLTGKTSFGVTNWDPATAQKLGAAEARPHGRAGRQRALLPLQGHEEDAAEVPDRDDLEPQLAGSDRGPQGDCRRRGDQELGAGPDHPALLRGHADQADQGVLQHQAAGRLLPLEQHLPGCRGQVRKAVGSDS